MAPENLIAGGTATVGLGGALLAQATQSPEVTWGSVILALIGLASLVIRSHYHLLQTREHVHELRETIASLKRIAVERKGCPFVEGEPLCGTHENQAG